MKFERASIPGIRFAYAAFAEPWQFLVIRDETGWTISYRQIEPTRSVSASSTIEGPFQSFEAAKRECDEKLAALRSMA